MYRVITDTRIEDFYNLNQVYGYLIGMFDNYRKYHPSIKFFKRWYQARCKRGIGKEEYSFGTFSFKLEKLTPSLRQAHQSEK